MLKEYFAGRGSATSISFCICPGWLSCWFRLGLRACANNQLHHTLVSAALFSNDDVETVGFVIDGRMEIRQWNWKTCNPSRTAVVRGDLVIASYESNEARDGQQHRNHGYCAGNLKHPRPRGMDVPLSTRSSL